ncbi:MAG: gliding motility protein GldN [Bacteroidetes bacterium]|nr:gliding motility protein GldN [Bacteroidota bacterium]
MKKITLFALIAFCGWKTTQAQNSFINISDTTFWYEDFEYVPSVEDIWTQGMTYERLMINERKPVPQVPLREADVMWASRVERMMDTREKQNLSCRWPKNDLASVIFKAAEMGYITPYRNDSFSSSYRRDTLREMLGTKIITQIEDTVYGGWIPCTVVEPIAMEDISRWKIIEEWIFDKQSGQLKPLIVGIAPMYNLVVEGQMIGEFPAFYVNWKEAKQVLIREEMFNKQNDGARLSYYDFFQLRLFSSYITKVPNVFDEDIANYEEFRDNPLGAQIEDQKQKRRIMEWESDLWQY